MAGYGDQMRQTDEYGNPIRHGTGAGGGANMGGGGQQYGTTDGHGGIGGGTFDTGLAGQQHGQLRRPGSSSSSSSEDDGMGGRRKKGIKEKIKEKLPGGHKDETETEYGGQTTGYGQGTGTTGYGQGTGYGQTGQQQQEKKGMMEKIKEKLPGGGS